MAHGVLTKRILPKATKAIDMRFWWLRDRQCQKMFRFYWRPGPDNDGDYWSKHHPAAHHKLVRPKYLTDRKWIGQMMAIFKNVKCGMCRHT